MVMAEAEIADGVRSSLTLPDDDRQQARFARSGILRGGSLAVFGYAMRRLLAADPAYAYHHPSPSPCAPSGACDCCSGRTCCTPNCSRRTGCGGPTNNGWYACSGIKSSYYFCADWYDNGMASRPCICREYIGKC